MADKESEGVGLPPLEHRSHSAIESTVKADSSMVISTSMPILPGSVPAVVETEQDRVLREVATSDELPVDWLPLKESVKAKVDQHIEQFKLNENSLFDKAASPPWPMDVAEIDTAKSAVFKLLDAFPCSPKSAPFTIQRLAELALSPSPSYSNSLPKYLRALTSCLLITSDTAVYPPREDLPPVSNGVFGIQGQRSRSSSVSSTSSSISTSSSQSHAMAVLTPIPWLNRSPSPAPQHSPVVHPHSSPLINGNLTLEDESPSKRSRKDLGPDSVLVTGRVDELDTVAMGSEMMQEPVALTSTQSESSEGTLGSRFASAENVDEEEIGVAK